ncbi:MAG TPA: universal stress protein [Streptosporangiaceae bacterium]|nr:universal stress protein [Streptosporangiaceae bacterium]
MRDDIPAGRRIVVGVDGSPASVTALAWAAREAQLRRAQLHAVCAWEDAEQCCAPYAAHSGLPGRDESMAAATSTLAISVRAVFGPAPPCCVRAEVAEGRPERVLLDRVVGTELLVLGAARLAGDFPAVGPVHRACLRAASCPVVFVGPDAAGQAEPPPTWRRQRMPCWRWPGRSPGSESRGAGPGQRHRPMAMAGEMEEAR